MYNFLKQIYSVFSPYSLFVATLYCIFKFCEESEDKEIAEIVDSIAMEALTVKQTLSIQLKKVSGLMMDYAAAQQSVSEILQG